MNMKRTFLGGLIGIFPCAAFSLGIGEVDLSSFLHTPLDAKIPIFSSEDLSKESIKVRLADNQAFQRAGLERYHHLTKLIFEVKQGEKGQYFIELKSRPPIREPFLSFLLEVSWSTGSLIKEYTLLLDPPAIAAPAVTEVVEHQNDTFKQANIEILSAGSFEVIPVNEADTLWAIAMRYRPQGMSVFSTMQVIHQNNPNAFIANNMNLLKAGAQLEIPTFGMKFSNDYGSEGELSGVDRAKTQQIGVIDFAELESVRQESTTSQLGAFQSEAAESSATESSIKPHEVAEAAPEPNTGGLLRLVVADTLVEDSADLFAEEASTGESVSEVSNELSEKIALTEESLDTLIRENIELRQQVASLREQAMNFDNGIELANSELKAMQAAQAKELHEIRKRIRESIEANRGGSSLMWLSILLGLFSITTALLLALWYRDKVLRKDTNQVAQSFSELAVEVPKPNTFVQGQKDLTISKEDLVELETLDDTPEDFSDAARAVSEEALLSLLTKEPLNQAAHVKLLRLYQKADNQMAFQRHKDSLADILLEDEDFKAKLLALDESLQQTSENLIQPILKSDALKQAVYELKDKGDEGKEDTQIDAEETKVASLRLEPVDNKWNTPKTAKESAVFRVEEDSDLGSEDKNATKLDLARAFIEMNSIYNARLMLQQVIEDGSDLQANEAKELLKRT